MPFFRPTLSELIARAEADYETRLPGTDARVRRSNLGVLARVHSGAVHMLYGFLDFIARQVFPDTAEAEFLARWCGVWGVGKKAADYAAGAVLFTGTDGAVVPAGTLLSRADGAEYATDADGTIAGGSASVAVTALEAGIGGNAAAGLALTLVSPVAGIAGTATVAGAGLGGGADEEGDEALRDRLLDRIRQPPHGGAAFDYAAWGREVAGVTRVWVSPMELGPGTVTVRFVCDDDPGGPIPGAAKVEEIQAWIEARRPVTAEVFAVAPVAVPLDITFSTLSPNTQAVREAVASSLQDLLRREAEPGGTILLSHLREAISTAAGEMDYVMISPAADVIHGAGEMATMGVITWPA